MGVRALIKKLKRAFPEATTGFLTVNGNRIVYFHRGERQVRVKFDEPNQWNLSTPSGLDLNFTQEERAFIMAVGLLVEPGEDADLIAHTEIGDALWREFHDGVVSEGMLDLNRKMVEEVLVRKNDSLFEYRPIPAEPQETMRIPIQCEPGWFRLIGDCLDRVRAEMQAMEWADYRLKISCVKEKFAGLRIYFNIKEKNGRDIPGQVLQGLYNSISNHIAVAEVLAHSTCEVCGKGGRIHGSVGEHLQTLCDHHAHLRKRSSTPAELRAMFGNTQRDGLHFIKLIEEEKRNDELRIRRDGSPQNGTESPA